MKYVYVGLAAAAVLLLGGSFIVLRHVMPSRYRPDVVAGATLIRVPDGQIRYELAGSGTETLLLLHGFQGNLNQWDPVWDRMGNCEVRRLRIDVPGFGDSRVDSRDYSLDAEGERIIRFLDALDIPRVTLAGTSMGGSLAAWIAAKHPDRVSGLVLFAPSGYPGSLSYPGLFGMLVRPGPLNALATRIAGSDLYARIFPNSMAVETLTLTASYGQAWRDALPRIQAPTLIAWSAGDTTALPFAAEGVQRAIAGSALLMLDATTRHSIPNSRPELAASILCSLARGADVRETVDESRQLLRMDEGLHPPQGRFK
ncbi:MAG: hypothetical protein RLZZ200_2350 [Pseudomonadota bacterium]|jgi:pimeloyl-ACP methyl ester carboxylesterase